MDHIAPNLGNIVFIGLASMAFGFGSLAFLRWFAQSSIPGISAAANGLLKILESASTVSPAA